MTRINSNIYPHLFMIIVPCLLELGVLRKYKNTILNLALVCKDAMQVCAPYISLFQFWVKNHKKRGPIELKYYKPKMMSDMPALPSPLQVTHLSFSEKFSENLYSPHQLPPSLTHVKFGTHFNGHISPGALPSSLMALGFGDKFNRPLPTELPSGLKHLWFGTDYNMPLPVLPKGLTHLSFGIQPHIFLWAWHDDIITDLITSTAFTIQKEDKFNHSLNGVLPSSLTHLSLGKSFSLPFVPPSPCNISFLRVGDCFNHSIPFRGLPKLNKLILGWNNVRPLPRANKIPSKLTNLVTFFPAHEVKKFTTLSSLAASFSYDEPNQFPSYLKYGYFLNHFRIYSDISVHLKFLRTFTIMTHLVLHIQGINLTLDRHNLPPSLTHLHIILWSASLESGKIVSPSLLHLSLPKCKQIEIVAPRLTHLSLVKIKLFPLLPSTTAHVAFGPLQKKFPSIKKKGSYPLPPSLTHLKLGPGFISLPPLPSNLAHLSIASTHIPITHATPLPSSLRVLRIPRDEMKIIKVPLAPEVQIEETNMKEEGYEWRPSMFATDW